MKRILFLLLVALPFQMSWSVAAAYCLHEEGKAAQHFGHHAHKHVASQADADGDSSSSLSSQPHTDCASCQISPLGIVLPTTLALAPNFTAIPEPDPTSFLRSIVLAGPERPQWAFAVPIRRSASLHRPHKLAV